MERLIDTLARDGPKGKKREYIVLNVLEMALEEEGPSAINLQVKDSPSSTILRIQNSTALILAARYGLDEVIKRILSIPETDCNIQNEMGMNALLSACDTGTPECVRLLLEDNRVKANEVLVLYGNQLRTCLEQAAFNLDPNMLKMYLASMRHINPNNAGGVLIRLEYPPSHYRPSHVLSQFVNGDTHHAVVSMYRRDLGLEDYGPVTIFVPVVLVCDGYFTISTKSNDNTRFFNMITSLPIELQMTICNMACGLGKRIIKISLFEKYLKIYIADGWMAQKTNK